MADNKWTKPTNPPPPLFLGEKERDLVKQVNDELLERVIGQAITYLPLSMEYTNFHPLYGEAIEKSFLPPVRVYALVEFDGIGTTTSDYGLDKTYSIVVRFHERRLQEDQNLYVREGDYVQYGSSFFEIVNLTEDRQLFGQVEHLFQIEAQCVRTRKGLIDFQVLSEEVQRSAIANATAIAAPAAPAEEPPAPAPEAPEPYEAAQIVYEASDPDSEVAGVIATPIAEGESINDLFGIAEGTELDLNTMMIFQNGLLQLVTETEGVGDFYLNEDNEIISNGDLAPGTTLVVIFLSAIMSYFGA